MSEGMEKIEVPEDMKAKQGAQPKADSTPEIIEGVPDKLRVPEEKSGEPVKTWDQDLNAANSHMPRLDGSGQPDPYEEEYSGLEEYDEDQFEGEDYEQ